MSQWWYFLSRSSGIVATVLASGSIVWGLRFSARETGSRLRPNWWLDLHKWLGGLTLAFTALHLLAVFADSDTGIGFWDLFVPGRARLDTTAIAWGVIASDIFAVVVWTSWPKLRLRRWLWRAIHVTSIPATVLVGIHAYQIGSDATTFAFRAMLVVLTAIGAYPLYLRLLEVARRRLAKSQP